MTTKEAITHRALRCRPSKRDTYVTTHEALLAEAEYLQQQAWEKVGEAFDYDSPPYWHKYRARRSFWQIIKGWFA